MGLLEFIMMKNLFGKSGGGAPDTGVMAVAYHAENKNDYINTGDMLRISDLTPSALDLENNIIVAGYKATEGINYSAFKLIVMENDGVVALSTGDSSEFAVIVTTTEVGGFPAGIYMSNNFRVGVSGGTEIESAYLIWEPSA